MTAGAPGGVTSVPDSVLIKGAKLFDGDRFVPRGCLLVLEGRVAALDLRLTAPAGVPVLDARGGTVLPGLIDAHVHVFPGALQGALGDRHCRWVGPPRRAARCGTPGRAWVSVPVVGLVERP